MRIFVPCLFCLTLFAGCTSTIAFRTPWERVGERAQTTETSAPATQMDAGVVAASDASKQPSDEGADPVAATLQQIEGLDGKSRAALAADLEKVPPSLRPLVLSQLEAVAKRGREEQTGRETESPLKPPAPPQSRTIAAQDKRPESGPSEPKEEEPKAPGERTACVQCKDEAVPVGPSEAAGRNTSPFDRLAALARAEDREQVDESRKAADAIARVDAAAGNRETGNQGTRIRRVGQAAEPASYVLKSEDSRTWQNALDETIKKLESASPPEASSADAVADLARLRLLQLAAGRRSEALAPIPALSADGDAFLTKTLFGLDVWLDNRRIVEEDRRAAAALPHLTEAIGHLGEVAPLSVRNLQLCTAVQSFGVVEPFKTDSFRPGQEVLVYAEVENFHSEETAEGFETILEGRILIFDSRGQRVGEIELPKKEDRCNRRRRDFFLVYQVPLPERLYPGSHSLKLTVEDAGCHKIGQSTLKFAVSNESE